MTDTAAPPIPQNTPSAKVRSRHVSELAAVSSGKILSLLSMFICGMLVARATGPTEYGAYAAALTVVMILDAVIGTPWDLAAMRFGSHHSDDPPRVQRYLGAAIRLKLLICAALGIVVAPVAWWVAPRLMGAGAGQVLLWIALASAVALLALRSTAAYLQLSLRFRLYGASDAFQGLLRLVLVGAMFAWGSISVAAPYVAASGIAPAIVFVSFLFITPQHYIRARWPDRADLHSLLRYVGATSFTVLVGTLSAKCDVLILASVRSKHEAGVYAAALQITTLVTLLASYAAIVIQPRLAHLVSTGKIYRLLRWNLLVGLVGGGIATVLAIWLSPRIIPLVFGGKFAPSIPVLRVLAGAMLIDVLQFPVLLPLVLQLYPRASLVAEVIIAALFLLAAFVAAAHGAVWLAWVATGVRAVKLIVYTAIALLNLRRSGTRSASA